MLEVETFVTLEGCVLRLLRAHASAIQRSSPHCQWARMVCPLRAAVAYCSDGVDLADVLAVAWSCNPSAASPASLLPPVLLLPVSAAMPLSDTAGPRSTSRDDVACRRWVYLLVWTLIVTFAVVGLGLPFHVAPRVLAVEGSMFVRSDSGGLQLNRPLQLSQPLHSIQRLNYFSIIFSLFFD